MVIGEKMTSHDWQQSRAVKSETKSYYSPITVEPEKSEQILILPVMINKTFPNLNLDDATKYQKEHPTTAFCKYLFKEANTA